MGAIDWRDYIVSDERILRGKPTVKGTRLCVEFALELLAAGWDRDSIREHYPHLSEEAIRAVLSYAAHSIGEERFYSVPPLAESR
jgi:uncharacterized protein (DUF433 family)